MMFVAKKWRGHERRRKYTENREELDVFLAAGNVEMIEKRERVGARNLGGVGICIFRMTGSLFETRRSRSSITYSREWSLILPGYIYAESSKYIYEAAMYRFKWKFHSCCIKWCFFQVHDLRRMMRDEKSFPGAIYKYFFFTISMTVWWW